MLAAAQGAPYGPLWTVALCTGMRQAEIRQLTWGQVDLEARRIRVIEGKTLKARRYVSLTDAVVTALHDAGPAGDPDTLVFPSGAGTPIDRRNLLRAWHDFSLEVLGRRLPFHALRHACATLMLEAGVPLRVISEVLGHSGIAITADVYVEVVDALKDDAAARLSVP